MDNVTKKMVGRFLAEVYEIKALLKNSPIKEGDKAYLYALKNGFESVLNDIIDENWWVSIEDEKKVAEVLSPYYNDQNKLNEFTGFYDIENKLEEKGIERLKAQAIIKYFWAKGNFKSVIKKMDSTNSPQECRTFEIDEFDLL